MQPATMTDAQHDLFFHVRRSIFYHERRVGFFEFWHRLNSFLAVMLAGSFLFQYASNSPANWYTTLLGGVAATLAGFDVIVGYAKCADIHRELKRRFIDLECQMIVGDGESNTWLGYHDKRLKIQIDEPVVYRALDLLCHNQTVMALNCDKSDLKNIPRFKALTANIIKWNDIASSLK